MGYLANSSSLHERKLGTYDPDGSTVVFAFLYESDSVSSTPPRVLSQLIQSRTGVYDRRWIVFATDL